jgi:hypothetical protein
VGALEGSVMLTPEEKASPERQTKRAARDTFKTARSEWRDAKGRIGQIRAQIDAGDLTDTEKGQLKDELRDLKAALPGLGETMRSTKATWKDLKERLQANRNPDRGSGSNG